MLNALSLLGHIHTTVTFLNSTRPQTGSRTASAAHDGSASNRPSSSRLKHISISASHSYLDATFNDENEKESGYSTTPGKRRKIPRNNESKVPPTPISLPRRKGRQEVIVEIESPVHGRGRRKPSALKIASEVIKSDNDVIGTVGKIHLLQEKVRHDPWKILIATSLLNVTSGRAAQPIFWEILQRWPNPQALSLANLQELTTLLYPLGLSNKRALSLIKFSSQYIELSWPITAADGTTSPSPLPIAFHLDVKVFHGAGVYASDSFRIFSDLLPGGGGPAKEVRWLEKRKRAVDRLRAIKVVNQQASETPYEEEWDEDSIGESMSDEEGDDSSEEWRSVRPNDKELRKYLIWRWGIEGIQYDILKGPIIDRDRDMRRLSVSAQ